VRCLPVPTVCRRVAADPPARSVPQGNSHVEEANRASKTVLDFPWNDVCCHRRILKTSFPGKPTTVLDARGWYRGGRGRCPSPPGDQVSKGYRGRGIGFSPSPLGISLNLALHTARNVLLPLDPVFQFLRCVLVPCVALITLSRRGSYSSEFVSPFDTGDQRDRGSPAYHRKQHKHHHQKCLI